MDKGSYAALLHEHYKDTFVSIRERERERDRLFTILIAATLVLALQVVYPEQFGGVVESFGLGGTSFRVGALSAAAILSATWIFVSVIALRYGQRVVRVERQYDYLHGLENRLGELVDDSSVFCREGQAYFEASSPFEDWTWVLYIIFFPIVGILATALLLVLEWCWLDYPLLHRLLDTAVAVTIIVSLYLYQLHPPSHILGKLQRVTFDRKRQNIKRTGRG